ncbi:MAG: TadE/TadG family type IV pilus assembly protein [Actinomycetota bacterium]
MIARLHRDERGIIISFFVKLILVLAVVGLAAVDTTAVFWARFQAQDIAETAARVAADTFRQTGSVPVARQAAAEAVHERAEDARLGKSFVVRPDGTIRVTVVKPARTLLIQHIGFLEGLTVARGKAAGNPPV